MNNIFYIDGGKLADVVNRLKKSHRIFSPVVKSRGANKETEYSYKILANSDAPAFSPYRAVEPLKSFFTYFKEPVAGYFTSGRDMVDLERTIIFGVKSCDIAGHRVQDFVFLEGVETDTLYRARRDNTILISSDCTDYKKACHCLAWEILPYPTYGFDLNLSPLNDGYLVEAGSKRGEVLIGQYREYFSPASAAQKAARQAKRDDITDRLNKYLAPQGLVSKTIVQKLMKDGYAADTWQQFMQTCVECGGCNLICDTCHCFLLGDAKGGQGNEKVRVWDSCLYANYARVAGGANPLKLRAQRLRNRFVKKFDFFVDNMGVPACCGCGRCIEVCPGKIDIREVLKDLAKKVAVNDK